MATTFFKETPELLSQFKVVEINESFVPDVSGNISHRVHEEPIETVCFDGFRIERVMIDISCHSVGWELCYTIPEVLGSFKNNMGTAVLVDRISGKVYAEETGSLETFFILLNRAMLEAM